LIRALWIYDSVPPTVRAIALLTKHGLLVDAMPKARTSSVIARVRDFDVVVFDTRDTFAASTAARNMSAELRQVPVLVLTDSGTSHAAEGGLGATRWQPRPSTDSEVAALVADFARACAPWDWRWRKVPDSERLSTEFPVALERWAWHVRRPSLVRCDPRTLAAWGHACGGIGETTLREITHGVGLRALPSCRLARAVWVLNESVCTGESVEYFLGAADPRTLRRWLSDAGITDPKHPPSVHECLSRQTFITADHPALIALQRLLKVS